MVSINSTPRLFSINSAVILTQTDTTVGFLSQDIQRLQEIKSRDSKKPFITVYKTFSALKYNAIRVPNIHKSTLRRAKKTSFIIKNRALRVTKSSLNSTILTHLHWNYSTSANKSGKNFERTFCEQKTDIIIEDKNSFYEGRASRLYKINKRTQKRLR